MGTNASTSIEAWFTGPDDGRLEQLAEQLAAHGGRIESEPWNIFEGQSSDVARPWSLVLRVPAALDPTLVAALAHDYDCEYHPGGGSQRWAPSPVEMTRSRRRPWRRRTR